jgi:hypothetical protein
MKYTIQTAHWRLPGVPIWLEGAPTPDQRASELAEVARKRATWRPSEEAWNQLRDLECFIGRRVRIQFWHSSMLYHEDESPDPIFADCRGIVLLRDEGFLQPFMILDHIEELPNSLGYSSTSATFIDREKVSGLTLGPIAKLYEISAD